MTYFIDTCKKCKKRICTTQQPFYCCFCGEKIMYNKEPNKNIFNLTLKSIKNPDNLYLYEFKQNGNCKIEFLENSLMIIQSQSSLLIQNEDFIMKNIEDNSLPDNEANENFNVILKSQNFEIELTSKINKQNFDNLKTFKEQLKNFCKHN